MLSRYPLTKYYPAENEVPRSTNMLSAGGLEPASLNLVGPRSSYYSTGDGCTHVHDRPSPIGKKPIVLKVSPKTHGDQRYSAAFILMTRLDKCLLKEKI